MKTKKTLKRLNKVVALLSNVIGGLPDKKNGLEDLLGSAKANVVQAKKMVHSQPANGAAKTKPPEKAEKAPKTEKAPKAEKAGSGRLSAEGRKNISLAAKKRWAKAKRKGVNPVTGRRLSKTA
jgi:hypothetical protein